MGHKQALLKEHAVRLREMMALWWAGRSSSRIAKAHGLTQQRAHQILASVGCTARARCECGWNVNADERHADRNEVIEAQVMMESVAWLTLTTLSRLSVRCLPEGRLRRRPSPRYLRISPLHLEFPLPLRSSSHAV